MKELLFGPLYLWLWLNNWIVTRITLKLLFILSIACLIFKSLPFHAMYALYVVGYWVFDLIFTSTILVVMKDKRLFDIYGQEMSDKFSTIIEEHKKKEE